MRILIAIFACIAVASAGTLRFARVDESLNEHWELFKTSYKKAYETIEHETVRRMVWESNLRLIEKHNLEADMKKHTFRLGMNKYGDLTGPEYRDMLLGYRFNSTLKTASKAPTYLPAKNVQLPETVDWRPMGYVTDVKDQKQCGSCWAFSATGSLEGQTKKKTGVLVSLSEQNLVDCSKRYGNQGCKGGLMDNAFRYIKANKGIDTEMSYPYTARTGLFCRFKQEDVGATDTGFVDIQEGNEDDLKNAVATVGPISVAIDASHSSFQLYRSGVYTERRCSSRRLDHGVLAVGYGTHSGKDYWLVKNSWGESWGMDGYIMMARNEDNQCGIATQASYPLV